MGEFLKEQYDKREEFESLMDSLSDDIDEIESKILFMKGSMIELKEMWENLHD